ncbi:MAG: hypothetical protein GC179_16280 [Anaerolineaceae bacterium]|nr:hypothetical protein [Anaerolineaceae bacterium]
MPLADLLYTTGRPQIDRAIAGVVSIYEAAFPARVRGYYLVGSLSRGTAGSNSDIDLEIIFKDTFLPDEAERLILIRQGCRALSPIHLDLPARDEASLPHSDTVAIKSASTLVYGEDTRASMPLPSIETYLRRVSIPTHRALTLEFRPLPVSLPLSYPQPETEFYGYVATDPNHPHFIWGTKIWVLDIGWMATFLLAYQASILVPSKDDMPHLYREHINDTWTTFIIEVHDLCRLQWEYTIPSNLDDRARLRALCEQTLAYENHVLNLYQAWLKSESEHGDTALAAERLKAFK